MRKLFAQKLFSQSMRRATRLTRVGALMDATQLIQKTLLGSLAPAKPLRRTANQPAASARRDAYDPSVVDVQAREIKRLLNSPTNNPVISPSNSPEPQTETEAQTQAHAPQGFVMPAPETPTNPEPGAAPPTASFSIATFSFGKEAYPYRLFIPARPAASSYPALMPLIVLLHGCTQNALDFSNGTAMNALANEHGCMVLYPEQIPSANAARCWNWFEPGHQKSDRGEPGMIAALVRKVIQQHGADPERIYIAGLSAGGAMAAVVAGLYPQLFAALGVHSGLAAGAAKDLMSAFSAMRSGPKGQAKTANRPALPTIVFHGTADKTVHPDNGDFIADAALAALNSAGVNLHKSNPTTPGSSTQQAERVVYRDVQGKPYVEHWSVSGGAHAWSGGDAAGSYTDPDGPSASRAMLTFFLQHSRGPNQAKPDQ